MYKDSEKIQEALKTFFDTYHIEKAVIFCEQVQEKGTVHRVLVYQNNATKAKFNPFVFAQLFLDSIVASKTFQLIMEHVNILSLQKLARSVENEEKLNKEPPINEKLN